MPRALVTRRLTALVASTALLSAAGLASGALVGVASAQTATAITPKAVSNTSATPTTLTIAGSGFTPASTTVTIVPTVAGDEVVALGATVDTNASTATSLVVNVALQGAAPEAYDVTTSQPATLFGSPTVSTCTKCLTVTSAGTPTLASVVADGALGSIKLTGTNFARGAKVTFFTVSGSNAPVADPALTFVAGHDTTTTTSTGTTTTHTTGYPVGGTTITGVYTPGAGAIAGVHYVVVTNLDGSSSKDSPNVVFSQPSINGTTPVSIGQGATSVPVTVTGAGFSSGSTLIISSFSAAKTDITLGTTVVTSASSITVPVSVAAVGSANAGSPSTRTATVIGPDGAYTRGSSVAVTAPPVPTGLSISGIGQGAKDVSVTVSGSNFQPGIVFAISGTGVTAVTTAVTASSATILLTATSNAPLGARTTLTATNTDRGVGTRTGNGNFASPYPLTVTAAPTITSVSPRGLAAGASKTVTITGTGFDTAGVTVDSTPGSGISFGAATVVSSTSLTVPATASSGNNTASDVIVTNTADRGSVTCVKCIGVDAFTVGVAAGANTNAAFDETFAVIGSNSFAGATAIALHKSGAPVGQPDLQAVSGTVAQDGKSAVARFDLTQAASGQYDALITISGSSVLSCGGCVTVSGSDFVLAAPAVTPNQGGRGATSFPITLHATSGFQRGEVVTIAGTTVSPTTYVNATTVTALITIPSTATLGPVDVVVATSDGSYTHTATGAYTIVEAPVITSVSTPAVGHKNLGLGATNVPVTIVGTGFANARAFFSGTGVTSTGASSSATALASSVTVLATELVGPRDVTVVNADNGGTSAVAPAAVVLTARPTVTAITPSTLAAGATASVTITGTGFQKGDALATIPDVTFSATTVSDDGTTLTATAAVVASAAAGTRTVTVTNGDGGSGACAACFTVSGVSATALSNSVTPAVTAGDLITAAGRLSSPGTGAGIANAVVHLGLVPAVGPIVSVTVLTDSNGSWTYGFRRYYTTTVYAWFTGDSAHPAVNAVGHAVNVATKVVIGSPGPATTSRARSGFVVTGTTTPNKAGQAVYLYKVNSFGQLQAILKGTVLENGTYRLALSLAPGYYTFRVSVPSGNGNTTGLSSALAHHFT